MGQNDISIAKQVRLYIGRKPYIIEAIEQNIVNYSALAREVARDIKIKNIDTVKVSLIRYGCKYQKTKKNTQNKAIKILKNANFSIKNKIATLHHSNFVNVKNIAYSKTPSGYMFFLDENIAKASSYKKIEYGFAIIHIKSDKEIEHTPGAIAFLLSVLASEGINVSHVMGCREDTFIVISEHDAPIAFRAFSSRLRL